MILETEVNVRFASTEDAGCWVPCRSFSKGSACGRRNRFPTTVKCFTKRQISQAYAHCCRTGMPSTVALASSVRYRARQCFGTPDASDHVLHHRHYPHCLHATHRASSTHPSRNLGVFFQANCVAANLARQTKQILHVASQLSASSLMSQTFFA